MDGSAPDLQRGGTDEKIPCKMPRRTWLRDVLEAAALHLALGGAVFAPALLTGDLLVPADLLHTIYPWGAYLPQTPSHNPALLDVIQQFYPWFLFFRDELLAGRFPLWNPSLGLGLPHAANPLTASFFPLSLLALFGPTGWNLLLLLRLAVAGTGTYLFLRRCGRSRLSSALGSVAFAYSQPFFSYLPMSIGNVTAVLPWLLLAAWKVGAAATWRSAAFFGVTLALMHFGGQPEATALYALAALAVAIAVRRTSWPKATRIAALLLVGGLAGTVAASVHLLPFLDYLRGSRAFLDPEVRTTVLPAAGLVSWVVPGFFDESLRRLSWGGMPPAAEYRGFAGTLALGLAVAGIMLSRRRQVVAPVFLFLLGISLPFGLPPLSFLKMLPVLDRARTQRILPLAALAVAWMAAAGIDRIAALRRSGRRQAVLRVSAAMFVPLAGAALLFLSMSASGPPAVVRATAGFGLARAGVLLALGAFLLMARVSEPVRKLGLSLVLFGDCWGYAFGFHGAEPRPTAFFETGVSRFLRSREGSFRVLPLGYTMPPNTNLPVGIASILSYDAIDDQEQVQFLRRMGGYHGRSFFSTVRPEQIRNPRVLELAGVRYLLCDPQAPRLDGAVYRSSSGLSLKSVYDDADGTIYELERARPLVWGSGIAVVDPGLVRFSRSLEAGDLSVVRMPFVDAAGVPGGDGAPVSASLTRRVAGEMTADVTAEGNGWLFVAEGGFPSWRATIDGRDVPVYRASGPFQAVPVTRGTHRVMLRYLPTAFRVGAGLSVVGVLALAGLALVRPRVPL